MSEDWQIWPERPYIPGQSPRHREGLFDPIRASAHSGQSPAELAQTRAFRMGLLYREAGFYWEAHEVLEPVWMALPDPGAERRFVQGLIQIANGDLKIEMNRPKAALRLATMARALIPETREGTIMGIALQHPHDWIDSLEHRAKTAL